MDKIKRVRRTDNFGALSISMSRSVKPYQLIMRHFEWIRFYFDFQIQILLLMVNLKIFNFQYVYPRTIHPKKDHI